MKNKKLLSRLFALLASLVLVFALSLPCFAAPIEHDVVFGIKTIVFSDRPSLYEWLTENYQAVVDVYIDANMYGSRVRFDTVIETSAGFNFQYLEVIPVPYSGGFNADPFYTVFYVGADNAELLQNASLSEGTGTYAVIEDSMWADLSAVVTINYLSVIENSGVPTDPTIPSSDMYSNLFNILKDAVYGSDAELTGSQEYALTLISTILTYATILLPVILVICIAVWCFKRF